MLLPFTNPEREITDSIHVSWFSGNAAVNNEWSHTRCSCGSTSLKADAELTLDKCVVLTSSKSKVLGSETS